MKTVTLRVVHTLGAGQDGKDVLGREVKSGVYFARLQAGKYVTTQKVVLVR
jgi:hypothetical protein